MPKFKQLGKNLKEYRKELGYTQEMLAEKVNIHFTFVGHIERGCKVPSLSVLYRLAKALKVSVDDLLKGV